MDHRTEHSGRSEHSEHSARNARVARAAVALFDARRTDRTLSMLESQDAPDSLQEAFTVQREMTSRLGLPIAGWKVGYVRDVRLTHAPVYADVCVRNGALVRLTQSAAPAVEGEVGFVLGRDLLPRRTLYTADEVADAVGSACAAIEIGAPRLANFMDAPLEHKIADNMGNCALIYGSGTSVWRGLDLAALRVRLEIDGQTVVDSVGGNAAGNPFDALLALANSPYREEPLRAGQVVITGTCTGIYTARPGMKARAIFDELGEVAVEID